MKHLRIWLYWPLCIVLRVLFMGPPCLLLIIGRRSEKVFEWLDRRLPCITGHEFRQYFGRRKR